MQLQIFLKSILIKFMFKLDVIKTKCYLKQTLDIILILIT